MPYSLAISVRRQAPLTIGTPKSQMKSRKFRVPNEISTFADNRRWWKTVEKGNKMKIERGERECERTVCEDFGAKVKVKIRKSVVYASLGRIKRTEGKFLVLVERFRMPKYERTKHNVLENWKCGREANGEKTLYNKKSMHTQGRHAAVYEHQSGAFTLCKILVDTRSVRAHFGKKQKALQKFLSCRFFAGLIKGHRYNNSASHLLLRSLAPKYLFLGTKKKKLSNFLNELLMFSRFLAYRTALNESFLGWARGRNFFPQPKRWCGLYLWNNKTYGCYRKPFSLLGFSHVHHERFSFTFICSAFWYIQIHLKDT